MSFTPKDPALADHLAWLGYVQPEGLVVSAPAMKDAQAIIDRAQLGDLQRRFAEHVSDLPISGSDAAETQPGIKNLPRLLTDFLGWQPEFILGLDASRPLPDSLTVSLPEFHETLQPTYAVKNPSAKEGASPWLLLVKFHPATVDLDKPAAISERNWHASPAKKFERLLRETGVPIGLLTNGTQIRLIYAPPKENSGTLKFPVGAMTEVSGRLILGGFHLLLSSWTLFNAPSEARLSALLQRSRDYQASVSEILAEQVLHALYELLRGFEAADKQIQGKLLRELAAKNSADIYGGLVTVLLRLVFTLFAEDRGLLPGSGLYVRHYAVHGLFERLRADDQRYPDTMDLRFGAWAQLLALFRVIYGGCQHPELKMPARAGHLFEPDRYPFLEGRVSRADPIGALPLVSDGVVFRILEKLCVLDGERVSYRALDVEEIGSVYQTIMGFGVEIAAGTAIALRGKRKHGGVPAAPVIYLEQLLAMSAKDRAKWLKEKADTELTGEADNRLKTAATVDDLLVVLEKRIDRNATPAPVANGGLVLQPTDERRRSGSHYTPRSFTEPIVRKTLEPILKRFGEQPKPEQILELKICDIAIGSGAFQVETCRQLADVLVRAWRAHGGRPQIPPDETEELLAMRTIAQRCLYGVDRNPMAVDLAKLSLWLATLAKDHPFTFLDHAIRCGDSLVGLTRRQIETFTWKTEAKQGQLWEAEVRKRTAAALRERQNLLGLGDDYGTPQLKRERLEKADELLELVRFIGNAAVAAFFAADKEKAREAKRAELAERIADYLGKGDLQRRPTDEVKALRSGQFTVTPFHWEIEYPEVFDRENPGFDGIVGNPPFLGGSKISSNNGSNYLGWVLQTTEGAHGNADLVAHFFRRAYKMLRDRGAFGLISTNTISQGDTRPTGLGHICQHGGCIYSAERRIRWPGQAAVNVSVIHILKNLKADQIILDGRPVQIITAFLFHTGGHENPTTLINNRRIGFNGTKVDGIGFTFDDADSTGKASSFDEMNRLLARSSRNQERIFRYLSGDDVNDSCHHRAARFIISFGMMTFEEASQWPELLAIVEQRVRPERMQQNRETREKYWWRFGEPTPALVAALAPLTHALVCCKHSKHLAFALVDSGQVFSNALNVFALQTYAAFCFLQSRTHEEWARFFASSLEDRLRYTPSDCFETFPFIQDWQSNAVLEKVGREYYEFRAALMQDLWLGLTEIYNLFHSPDDEARARLEALYGKRATISDWCTAETVPADRSPLTLYATPNDALAGVQHLRELHAAMDTAVLTSYGWTDLLPKCTCEFLLDYEDEKSDAEETGRQRKKPWRYRWPEEVRDEVLARLLKLNAERAEEERLAGEAVAKPALAKRTAKKVPVPKEQIGLSFTPRAAKLRKHSRGINFKRGAIASYAVNRLSHRSEFGRTQMEKVLYGAQQIIGVDLEMDFQAFAQGPFDKEIHKLESLAKKQQWFQAVPRQGGHGTAYHPGAKILDRCGAAKAILGEKLAEFDRVLDWMARMNSEKAGIWTTVHSVWNDLIIAGASVTDDQIVKRFYEFHEAKASIEVKRVRGCIQWLRDNHFVPRGIRLQTTPEEEQELPTDFRLAATQPLFYTTTLVVALLSEAGGSLTWTRLLDAFVLATNPKLLQRFALAEDASRTKAWAARWNENVPDGLLLPSLNQLGGRNLTVTEESEGRVFQLLDGPRPPATEDVRYDAWLALRVAVTLTPDTVPIPDRAKWTREANKLVLA